MKYRVTAPRGGLSAVVEVEKDGDINAALRAFAKHAGPHVLSLTLDVDKVDQKTPVTPLVEPEPTIVAPPILHALGPLETVGVDCDGVTKPLDDMPYEEED